MTASRESQRAACTGKQERDGGRDTRCRGGGGLNASKDGVGVACVATPAHHKPTGHGHKGRMRRGRGGARHGTKAVLPHSTPESVVHVVYLAAQILVVVPKLLHDGVKVGGRKFLGHPAHKKVQLPLALFSHRCHGVGQVLVRALCAAHGGGGGEGGETLRYWATLIPMVRVLVA